MKVCSKRLETGNSRGSACAWAKGLVLGLLCIAWALPVRAALPLVAIHDSEFTRALESMPASGATPSGPGTTGNQWWPTNWHYFVMPDAAKEMLRSDGTAFTVVGDSNIMAGALLDASGSPNYPILISLASEAMDDSEISKLTNYVAAGGFVFMGSSSFTRNTNGTTRGDFAISNQLGLHMVMPGLTNWTFNATFTAVSEHPLISQIPQGTMTWQMPASSEEISWPEANHVGFAPTGLPHLLWQVQAAGATVIAQGDSHPYLLVQRYGKGCFIYDAAMQPLLGHGGWAPGVYAYGIIRNAIQWAFQSDNMAIPKLSSWPYQYDAAVIFRHDMEAIPALIQSIQPSALFEHTNGARGDYYFCTGELREDMTNVAAVVASLQQAVTNYGATIASHNGGLTNINTYVPALTTNDYDYWHWGPDEVLNDIPPGYANGQAYAIASISNSFNDIQGWLGTTTNGGGVKMWVAPYFNATREASYQIQQQLGIQTSGDEKLGPFPHWTYSTQTPDLRYSFLSFPVSDWFLGSQVAQAMEDGHTVGSVQALVDYYYGLGALINLYSHSSSDGTGQAGAVASSYVTYSLSKPRMWSANVSSIYNWWLQRGNAQVTASISTNGTQLTTTLTITGASDPNTAVECYLPGTNYYGLAVLTNNVAAGGSAFRKNGQVVKILVGTTVTNAQVVYSLRPTAQNDIYTGAQGGVLGVTAPGVLTNDTVGTGGANLTAALGAATAKGTLSLNSNGGFTYTPTNNYYGVDSFTYQAVDAQTNSLPATVTTFISPTGVLFSDNFTRPATNASLAPWVQQLGAWSITNNLLSGTVAAASYGYCYFNTNWTDYTVQGTIQFSSTNAFGGGIGGRLNPATGAHYAAWIYPDGSLGGPLVLKLIKFEGWATWSGIPMSQVSLPSVGTGAHTVVLSLSGANLTVFVDGIQKISTVDNNFDGVAPYTGGGISVDMYADANPYTLSAGTIVVSASGAPAITLPPSSVTNTAGSTANFSVSAIGSNLGYQWLKGAAPVSGATNSTLTLTNVSDSSAANYSVIVSNQFGSVTSPIAVLTVDDPVVIVTQPVSVTNKAGSTVSFSVVANGTSPSYHWVKNGSNILANGGNISGAAAPTLVVSSITASDAASYTVVVSNVANAVTSSAATLTVTNLLPPSGTFFSDNFTNVGSIAPWVAQSGNWTETGGKMIGGTNTSFTYADAYLTNIWTNYAVQASFQFPLGAFGGGLGGDLNAATGARYMAWIYPAGSSGGSNVLSLIKFQTWTSWGYQGSPNTPMQQVSLNTNVGTSFHTVKLAFSGSRISVYFDGTQRISMTDAESTPYFSGGVSLDMWTDATGYDMSVQNVVVNPLVTDDSYSMNANTTLTVPAPGVLTNDSGVYGNPVTALLLSGTQNGSVNLTNNGGFSYVPQQGFIGTNYFTYQANDGSISLGQATATITVNPVHNGPRLPVQSNRTVLEQTLLTVTNTASDSDVPALTLNYQLVSPPAGAVISTNGIITWTPSRTQGLTTNTITTVVTDSGVPALSATNSFTVVVSAVASCIPSTVFQESFDGVTAPSLPAGWTTTASGFQSPWITTNTLADTAPNAAFSTDATNVGLNELVSPAIALPTGQAYLSFRNNYNFETGSGTDGYDGGVLEIKIGSGSFTDILAAGGSFVTGGYTSVIDTHFENPLAGRQAWSGSSGGYITTIAALPASASGQTVQLRWGCGTDNGNGDPGWRIDTIAITNEVCAANGGPIFAAQTNRSVNELVLLTVTNTAVDAQVPPLTLAYQLVSPPAGVVIDTNGVITWTPTKAQGPSSNIITTVATDSGNPPFSATNSFSVVVNEVNLPPLLPAQGNVSSSGLSPVVVTNTATDQNIPPKPLSYGLQVAPSGASIDGNGVIHWTPVSSQVPSTNTITTVVTNTDPQAVNATALTATNSFTVVISAVHNGPSLTVQTNQSVNELALLIVTNTAVDSDVPALSLTYQLVGAPSGVVIDTNGVITWTPTKAQGPATNVITTVVTDSGSPALSATNSFSVVVNEVNLPPLLPVQSNVGSSGLSPVAVTNTAMDQNIPAKPLSYGLQVAPSGASIDANGVIHWTPVASQVPGTNVITTVVTNTDPQAVNATALTATNSFTVVINAVHNGPSLTVQTNQSVNELALLIVTNTAVDSDVPALSLTYQLVGAPSGVVIDTNGVITWTPTKAQGPATNVITTVVTDSGTPALSATNSFNVVVNEVNLPPLLPVQSNVGSSGTAPVAVANTATDQNIPAKPLSYGLQVAPTGATIDTNGVIRWTPVSSQVPSTNMITTVVTNTDPQAVNATALTATNSFTVVINAVHNGPSLTVQTNQSVNELALLTVTNTAVDSDVPALSLTYQLVSPPAGAVIDTNGVITWTPTKAQGPATNVITTVVMDSGSPALSATNSFNVVVNEVNLPPLLPVQSNVGSSGTAPVAVANTATDQNIPAKPLSYGLQVAPTGATIDTNGVIRWTPVASQVPGTNTITTVVTNTDPQAVNATALTATNSFTVVINAVHNGPSLTVQTNQSVNELALLIVTNTAVDSDVPALSLTYQLVGAPSGVVIDTNGVITWTPTKAQGPATNVITTVVTDSGTPALSATNSFNVVVNEVNLPPLLPAQGNVSSSGLSPVVVTNTATDQNIPPKPLSYGLQVAPTGATIDTNGVIHWTPVASQVPGTNVITTVVTNTDPQAVNATALTATNSFTVVISAVHNGPSLLAQTNQSVNELVLLTVTNTAVDSDVPALTLSYQLLSPPAGAVIDTNGVITWTPTKAQGPATNVITTVVTDNGSPALSATNSFSVVVNEVNLPPLLPVQSNVGSSGTAPVAVANTATDQNIPPKPLSYGLQVAPTGATIDTNGVIRWTPDASQVPGTNTITTVVTNTDPQAVNATALTATNSFLVVISAVHNGPSLVAQTNQSVNELVQLTVTNTAVDTDVPALSLTYQLAGAPSGAVIDTNGVITWTPTKAQGPATNVITTVVTDSGSPALSATNSFNVVVNEVNLPPLLPAQGNVSSSGLSPVVVTNTATDQNIPAKPLSYGLLVAPSGASIDGNGVITWTPVSSQVPSTNTITTVVTNTDPQAVNATTLTATNSFTVVISAVHNGPSLPAQSNRTVNDQALLTVTNTAADSDVPALTLSYQLAGAPSGMNIDANGVITWTPSVAQGSSTNLVTTIVTDDGTPALSATNSFLVFVNPAQAPPQPAIVSIHVMNGAAVVAWSSVAEHTYRLQYVTDPSSTNWSNVSPDSTATGTTCTGTDVFGSAPRRFYRVMVVQ